MTNDSNSEKLLACDCCGWIERPPADEGDECICGGIFKKYSGKIKKIGSIEFKEASNDHR